ncbi:MAG: NAD kinase [Saprospiraceae bacterium]|nr:NAD kinase [Saprospiraceae bacterium]
MQVVVFGKLFKEKDLPYVQGLFDAMQAEGLQVSVYTPYLELIQDLVTFNEPVQPFDDHQAFRNRRIDFVVVLGGDGTMLQALLLVRNAGVPLLGINLGRMGFLASVEKIFIRDAIQKLRRGQYRIEERTTLYLESHPSLFGDMPVALNDCTLLKRDTSSMITVHTFLNGDYLNSYWADGIILATPTGSTGYSLSCGGPVILPDSANFVLTPVAPHNLNVRPIVLSDESVISFEIEGRGDNFICTLDSRFELITAQQQLAVRKNDFTVKLVVMENITFLNTIREKLAWGADIRNY